MGGRQRSQYQYIDSAEDMPAHRNVLSKSGGPFESKNEWARARCAILLITTEPHKECVIVCTEDYLSAPTGYINIRSQLKNRGWVVGKPVIADLQLITQVNEISSGSTERGDQYEVKSSAKERQFDDIAQAAFRKNATDIHIEVKRSHAVIYFRIDKEMSKQTEMMRTEAVDLCRAVYQSLSDPDSRTDEFNERKRQKAVIERIIDKVLLRFRYQHAPVSPIGFDCVMRILPIGIKEQRPKTFLELGYSESHSEEIEMMFSRPEGVTIIAGTTGSGKSTTLQHAIGQVIQRKPRIKVRTVEDPVEYIINHASQTPVATSDKSEREDGRNRDFEQTISAIMRMDPDTIMIGEVRDVASADLLVKAVQSGHQVATTIHAGSAISIIARLVNLGVTREVIASPNFIAGLIYQKLVPVLCMACREEWPWGAEFPRHPGLSGRMKYVATTSDHIFTRGKGCEACGQRGIRGLTVCAETVLPDDSMLEMFARGNDINASRYWEAFYDPINEPGSLKGGKAFNHAVQKMMQGILGPEDVEDAFGFFLPRTKPAISAVTQVGVQKA